MAIDWNKFRQIARAVVGAERSVEDVSVAKEDVPVGKRINLCTEIKCPYGYKSSPTSSSGCRKYPDVHCCHLLRGRPDLQKEATEYFLHAESSSVNIAELKTQNDSFFLDDPQRRERLQQEVDFGEQILYAPYSEETFDLGAYLNQ